MRKYKLKLKKLYFISVFTLLFLNAFAQEIKSVKITEVENFIKESKTPLIVNMWATWCKPCIEELPYIIDEVNRYNSSRGTKDSLQLLLVSLDFEFAFPDGISKFATKRKITAPIYWLNETNADYFCPKIDPQWSGAIPATLFVNNKTGYRNFIEEQISHDELIEQIKSLVK